MIISIFGELIQFILKENNLEISKVDKVVKPIKQTILYYILRENFLVI